MALAFAGPMPLSALARALASAVLMLTGSACTSCVSSKVAARVGKRCFSDMKPPCEPGNAGQQETNNPHDAGRSRQSAQSARLFTLRKESQERQPGQRQCQVTLPTPH